MALGSLSGEKQYVVERRAANCSCKWLPVPVDLLYEQSRSKLVTVVILVQIYLVVTMNLWVPIISEKLISPMPSCWQTVLVLDPARLYGDSTIAGMMLAAIVAYYSYLLCGLVAVSRYHHPGLSVPAALLGCAYMVLRCIVDTRFCLSLVMTYGNIVVSEFGQTTVTISWFNSVSWALTLVAVVRLLLLAWEEAVQAWSITGDAARGDIHAAHPTRIQRLCWCFRARREEWGSLPGLSVPSAEAPGALAWLRRVFQSAPMRHNIACLLTSITLVTMCLYIATLASSLGGAIGELDAASAPSWLQKAAHFASRMCVWAQVSVWVIGAVLLLVRVRERWGRIVYACHDACPHSFVSRSMQMMLMSYTLIHEDAGLILDAYAPMISSSKSHSPTLSHVGSVHSHLDRSLEASVELTRPLLDSHPLAPHPPVVPVPLAADERGGTTAIELGAADQTSVPLLHNLLSPGTLLDSQTGASKSGPGDVKGAAPRSLAVTKARPVIEGSLKWNAALNSDDIPTSRIAQGKGAFFRSGALDLDAFDVYSASGYVMVHTASNIVVLFLLTLLITVAFVYLFEVRVGKEAVLV
jgi:hypothetical protein